MENLINTFYTAFQKQDHETMNSCYHDDIIFQDPAFGELHGDDAKAMWTMLCQRAKDFSLEFSDIKVNGDKGSAHWEARYTFSQTGRTVHNIIDAEFEFKDGKIIKHTDHFDLHRWAGQALGLKGKLLGGTKFFKRKLQAQVKGTLKKFRGKS